MDKKLLLGLGGIACVGAIGAGILVYNSSFSDKGNRQVNQEEIGQGIDEETKAKLEALYFEELKDQERYTFCIGREKISGTYTNAVMGNESGEIDYISEEINVIDKESQKMYILGRTIDYQYSGEGIMENSAGSGIIETKETGSLTEYYKKNEAPVRIDYYAQTIFPAPDRKVKDWVYVNVKMIGTVMGFTDERKETSKEDAKTFCLPFSLAGRPLENGAFITPDYFSFSKRCEAPSLAPGVNFSGDFEFTCDNIDYTQGISLLEEYKSKEVIDPYYIDTEGIFDSSNEPEERREVNDASASNIDEDGIDIDSSSGGSGIRIDSDSASAPTQEDLKKQLEDLRGEIQANQSGE
ncbi:MAG TPA: hypothetical protein PKM52_01220 [bacterium]|nr:hypothetical protein [bacterium]HQA63951.1 hypothetical protein [bacterium]